MSAANASAGTSASNGVRGGLTRVTVNLTSRSMRALNAAKSRSGWTRTDIINAAVQRYEQPTHDPNSAAAQIAALEVANDALGLLAFSDPLTGLPNRRVMDDEFAARMVSGRVWTAAMIDIDHFKIVNDEHGHAVGDAVIVCVAHRLAELAERIGDTLVVRLGGDEFVLVGGQPLIGAAALSRLCGTVIVGDHHIRLSVSIGTCAAQPGDDPYRVLHAADLAARAAKAEGRGRLVAHDRGRGLPEVAFRQPDRPRDRR